MQINSEVDYLTNCEILITRPFRIHYWGVEALMGGGAPDFAIFGGGNPDIGVLLKHM